MLKVKNNKCISRLADKSFRANKTRNIIAVIAIALTTILFTALFTIGSGAVESFQYNTCFRQGEWPMEPSNLHRRPFMRT